MTTELTVPKARLFAHAWSAVSPLGRWSRRSTSYPEQHADPAGGAADRRIVGPDGYLATLTPFTGNHFSGEWQGSTYVVRSYRTPILKVYASEPRRGQVELNVTAYSVCTSKHQQIAAAWAGEAVPWVDAPHPRQ